MKLKHVLIIILFILIVIFLYNKQEHLDATTPPLSNEAIQNIASVYNNQNLVVTNMNATGTIRGKYIGDLSGNVTGNLSGNVTGDLSGNVTGKVFGDLSGNNINIRKINNVSLDIPKYVWGVSPSQHIFRCVEPCTTGEWAEPNSNARLVDITVGKDYIYGVNSDNRIYACKKPCDTGEWVEPNTVARLRRIAGDNSL